MANSEVQSDYMHKSPTGVARQTDFNYILFGNCNITATHCHVGCICHTIGHGLKFSEVNKLHLPLGKLPGESGQNQIMTSLSLLDLIN